MWRWSEGAVDKENGVEGTGCTSHARTCCGGLEGSGRLWDLHMFVLVCMRCSSDETASGASFVKRFCPSVSRIPPWYWPCCWHRPLGRGAERYRVKHWRYLQRSPLNLTSSRTQSPCFSFCRTALRRLQYHPSIRDKPAPPSRPWPPTLLYCLHFLPQKRLHNPIKSSPPEHGIYNCSPLSISGRAGPDEGIWCSHSWMAGRHNRGTPVSLPLTAPFYITSRPQTSKCG
jgi:hypothetical protein